MKLHRLFEDIKDLPDEDRFGNISIGDMEIGEEGYIWSRYVLADPHSNYRLSVPDNVRAFSEFDLTSIHVRSYSLENDPSNIKFKKLSNYRGTIFIPHSNTMGVKLPSTGDKVINKRNLEAGEYPVFITIADDIDFGDNQ